MIDVILLHVIIFGSSFKCIFSIAGAAGLSKNVRAKCWKSCFRGFRFQNFPGGMTPDPLEKSREQPNLQQSDFGLDPPLALMPYHLYSSVLIYLIPTASISAVDPSYRLLQPVLTDCDSLFPTYFYHSFTSD